MEETVDCGGGELAMCTERPDASGVTTAEILTSKQRKMLEVASGVREHGKDGVRIWQEALQVLWISDQSKVMMCLISGRMLIFVAHGMDFS